MPYKNKIQTQRITSHYYPYGLTFADAGKGASVLPYKFGSKELDAMYGLNINDFHARTRTPQSCNISNLRSGKWRTF